MFRTIFDKFEIARSFKRLPRAIIESAKFPLVHMIAMSSVAGWQNSNRSVLNLQPAEPKKQPPPGNNEEEKALLISRIKEITSWDRLDDGELILRVDEFLHSVGILYLFYYQYHPEEAKELALEYKSILSESIPYIRKYVDKLLYIIEPRPLSMSDPLMFDPWEEVCFKRTGIEALIALFPDPMEALDVSKLEEYMQMRKKKGPVYRSDTPHFDIPTSHWWWKIEYRRIDLPHLQRLGIPPKL